jgi:hypothetical protein
MTRGSTKIFGYGALAMATAVIASVSVPGCTPTDRRVAEPGVSAVAEVEPPAPNKRWAGCILGDDTVERLIRDMKESASASGGGLGTPVTVVYVEVDTFRNNSGQPLPDPEGADTAPEGPHTGPVLCWNQDETQPPISVQQTDNIGGGDSTLDLLDLDNTGVRYRLNGVVEKWSCRAVGAGLDCAKFVTR